MAPDPQQPQQPDLNPATTNQLRQFFLSLDEMPDVSNELVCDFFAKVANALPASLTSSELSQVVRSNLESDELVDSLRPQVPAGLLGQVMLLELRLASQAVPPEARESIQGEIDTVRGTIESTRAQKRMLLGMAMPQILERIPEPIQKQLRAVEEAELREILSTDYVETAQRLSESIFEICNADTPIDFLEKDHNLAKEISPKMGQLQAGQAYLLRVGYFGLPEIEIVTPFGQLLCFKRGVADGPVEQAIPKLIDALGLKEIDAEDMPAMPFQSPQDRFFLITHTLEGNPLPEEYAVRSIPEYLEKDFLQGLWAEKLPEGRAKSSDDKPLSVLQQKARQEFIDLVDEAKAAASRYEGAAQLQSDEVVSLIADVEDKDGRLNMDALARLVANGTQSVEILYGDSKDVEATEKSIGLLVACIGESAVPSLVNYEHFSVDDSVAYLFSVYGDDAKDWFLNYAASCDDTKKASIAEVFVEHGVVSPEEVNTLLPLLDKDGRWAIVRRTENEVGFFKEHEELLGDILQFLSDAGDQRLVYEVFGNLRKYDAPCPERIVPLILRDAETREDNQWGLDLLGSYGRHAAVAIPLLEDKVANGNYWEAFYSKAALAAIRADIQAYSALN